DLHRGVVRDVTIRRQGADPGGERPSLLEKPVERLVLGLARVCGSRRRGGRGRGRGDLELGELLAKVLNAADRIREPTLLEVPRRLEVQPLRDRARGVLVRVAVEDLLGAFQLL